MEPNKEIVSTRAITLVPASNIIDEEQQVIQISISSETPVIRNDNGYCYYEVLLHTPDAIDLSRANDGAAVLEKHGGEQIGVFESAWIENRKVYAKLRFSKNNPEAIQFFKDMKDGILRNFSIDYSINSILPVTEQIEGYDKITANKWTLLGVSLAPIPADASIGLGRADATETNREAVLETEPIAPQIIPELIQDTKQIGVTNMENLEAIELESKRRDEIDAIAEKFANVEGIKDLAKKAAKSRQSIEGFNAEVLTLIGKTQKTETVEVNVPSIRTSSKATPEYSVSRVINLLGHGHKVDGYEGEMAREMELQGNGNRKGSFSIPLTALQGRSNDTTSGPKGTYLIEQSNVGFVDLLTNKMFTVQAGAQILPGMIGDLAFPKQTAGSTVTYLGDTAEVTASELALGQVISRPKHARALVQFSKGLVTQSNPSIEGLVRKDLANQLALAMDLSVLSGAGSAAPQGILNTSGIGTVNTSGMTYAKMLQFEATVSAANSDSNNMSFITTPAIRAALKGKEKATGNGFIWSESNEVCGYAAYATNQVGANHIYFGDFTQVLIPTWGSIEIDVLKTENYSKYGIFDVPAFLSHDVVVRNPGAFAVSTNYSA